MTLHEAIVQVLKSANRAMTTQQIANELNKTKAYQKRDGSAITDFQIHGRTRKYPHLFDRDGSKVSLKGEKETSQVKPIREKAKEARSASKTTEDYNIDKLKKTLMNETNYKSAKDIDFNVPQKPGMYCIRIKNISALPKPFSSELLNRKHNIIYIGIATQSLNKRMLNQELRAKGHGTFFRSLGAVRGYIPPFKSLASKKNKRNYKFSAADKIEIIDWINENLLVNWIEQNSGLKEIETALILKYEPLLNIAKNPVAVPKLSALRKICVEIANGKEQK